MGTNRKGFTWFERVMVVAIILFVAAVAVQNVLLSVQESEEQIVKSSATQYEAVRNMYERQNPAAFSGAEREDSGNINNSQFTNPH